MPYGPKRLIGPPILMTNTQIPVHLRFTSLLFIQPPPADIPLAIPLIISRLQETNYPPPFGLADFLSHLRIPLAQTILIHTVALTNHFPVIRAEAARNLARYGPAADAAVEPLSRALHDPDPAVRREADRAIRDILSPIRLPGAPPPEFL